MAQVNQPSNLLDRIIAIERTLQELTKKVGLSSSTISSGGLTVTSGAYFKVIDFDGQQIVYAGGAVPNRPDGVPQQVFFLSDDSGRLRMSLWDSDPALNGYRQFWAVWDYNGNIIMKDDVDSQQGLARPYISTPYPWHNRHSDWFITTTSNTFDPVLTYSFIKQHPKVSLQLLYDITGGATQGEIRITCGSVVFQTTYVGTSGTTQVFEVPGNHLDTVNIQIDLRVSGGVGTARVEPVWCYGRES